MWKKRILSLVVTTILVLSTVSIIPLDTTEGCIDAARQNTLSLFRFDNNESYASIVQERNQSFIVYVAYQEWPSRIYLLNMDGSVITYYEYWYYRFADVEIINNAVYVSEAFAPRVYKVDLDTGELEVIIDDWTLYYFYDIAFDGTFFYVTEWDLNRYDIYGNKNGTASFDEDVMGATWDGMYYWTLNGNGEIKCWNLSSWPAVIEVTDNAFSSPSIHCRGLWFDGQYFWTAESIEYTYGNIYQFDYTGNIVTQWIEPAFMGWSAGIVEANSPPEAPVLSGPSNGTIGKDLTYSITSIDPDNDTLFFYIDWGDNTPVEWIGPISSGVPHNVSHVWNNPGSYTIKAKAKDIHNAESEWSNPLFVTLKSVFTVSFFQNWNLVTIPLYNSWTAETLGENISGCTTVCRFHASGQSYNTHVVGIPYNDFPIVDGAGYFVYVNATMGSTLMATGLPIASVNVSLSSQWNMIGWYHGTATNASSLGAAIPDCTVICMYDAVTGSYSTHSVGIPYNDFIITQGMGLFIYATSGSYWTGEG
jgi:hypothetical protein